MENVPVVQKDLIEDDIIAGMQYTHASQGQRFINFLIDNLIMRLGLTYFTSYAIAQILILIAPRFLYSLINDDGKTGLYVLSFFIVVANYLVYYTLFEKLFKGKTIGKFISGTRAIRTDGEDLTFKDAILRSLCRLVPLEVFSGFGVPWHDLWTNTMVIKTRN